jgi:hypothetical protein
VLGEPDEVLVGPVLVEVQPELRRLDADLAIDAASGDRIEHRDVVVRDRIGLLEALEVLAEPGVHRPDAGGLQGLGGIQRRLEGLAGHEPTNGPAHEPESRQPLLQPCVAGRPEEQPAHHGSARTMPPSTGTMAPVTYEAAGDSRNAPMRPTS